RPPAPIGNQPRWPINRQPNPPPAQAPYPAPAAGQPDYGAQRDGPISLSPPGVATQQDEIDLPAESVPEAKRGPSYYPGLPAASPRERDAAPYSPAPYSQPQQPGAASPPRLGPSNGNPVMTVGPVAVKPTATLACPIVSALERWLADSVQPAALRWF